MLVFVFVYFWVLCYFLGWVVGFLIGLMVFVGVLLINFVFLMLVWVVMGGLVFVFELFFSVLMISGSICMLLGMVILDSGGVFYVSVLKLW